MKVVVITILILIIFFVGAIFINQHVQFNSEQMKIHTMALDKLIEENMWEEANIHMHELEKSWSDTKKLWLLFMEHSEIDSIDTLTAKVKRFIEIEEREMALGEIVILQEVIDHIIKKQSIKLSNIL